MKGLKKYKTHGLTVRDIALISKWTDVKRCLKFHHYRGKKITKDTLKRYEEIFEDIKKYPVEKQKYPKEKVQMGCWADYFDKDIPQYYSIATNLYSMSFRKWKELANIKIDDNTLDFNLREEILAAFLWEITYYGYHEKDGDKVGKRLNKIVKKIKSGEAKTVPYEEFKKSLKKK